MKSKKKKSKRIRKNHTRTRRRLRKKSDGTTKRGRDDHDDDNLDDKVLKKIKIDHKRKFDNINLDEINDRDYKKRKTIDDDDIDDIIQSTIKMKLDEPMYKSNSFLGKLHQERLARKKNDETFGGGVYNAKGQKFVFPFIDKYNSAIFKKT